MQLVSIKDLSGPSKWAIVPKILSIKENRHCWIGHMEFVQIAKSVFETFNQEICEKEMHLVFVQML